jgi:hypothetical protein
MWSDSLKAEEVEASLNAAGRLTNVVWAAPLLAQTATILERLRVGLDDKDAYRLNPISAAEASLLFELRFARALADEGVTATYEYAAGVGNSTVDFRVDLDPPWLVELVSLHESKAFKAASWKDGAFQGYVLRTDADDPKESEEGEMLKAQERIAAKVFERKQGAIKFPTPAEFIHMVMVDARGFMGGGHGDAEDWRQIVHGPVGLPHHVIQCWTNPKTGERAPIKGVFEQDCPLQAAKVIQERLHLVGVVCESSFCLSGIQQQSFYLCNPSLFSNEESAQRILRHWPLARHIT